MQPALDIRRREREREREREKEKKKKKRKKEEGGKRRSVASYTPVCTVAMASK